VAVGITVGIGIIELTGAATQNSASVAGTATTGLHAGIHWRTNKDVHETTATGCAGSDRAPAPRLSPYSVATWWRAHFTPARSATGPLTKAGYPFLL
jgi:hypothetical protein